MIWSIMSTNFVMFFFSVIRTRRLPLRIIFYRLCRKVTYRVVTCSDVTRMSLNLNASVTLADSSSRRAEKIEEIYFHISSRIISIALIHIIMSKHRFTYFVFYFSTTIKIIYVTFLRASSSYIPLKTSF